MCYYKLVVIAEKHIDKSRHGTMIYCMKIAEQMVLNSGFRLTANLSLLLLLL